MLLAASLLTLLLALMHSVVGGRRLIAPLTRTPDFPVILGDIALARLTLRVGWHALSVTWIAMAGTMAVMHWRPETRSPLFLWMVASAFAACGLAALILSRGRHRSWMLFLPVAALCAAAATSG